MAAERSIFSASYDSQSFSIVCSSSHKFDSLKEDLGWIAFKIDGEMPFGSVQGLISKISGTLIKVNVGVCVISTFQTDLFIIREKNVSLAQEALRASGWDFVLD